MKFKSAAFLLFLLLTLPVRLFADFKLLDAIEEFGEKRYVKPLASRLKAGPVRIHPSLTNQAQYDSNILLASPDPREDVIFNIQPGVILELPIDKHQLAVGYEADFEYFSKRKDGNQNDQNQNFFALADFSFPSWYVNVLENFSETSGRSGTTFTERIPRYDQSINPKIGYRRKRFTFESGFRHFVRDFRRQIDDPFDFQMVEYTGVLFYDLFARLKALLEYQWGQIDYDDNAQRKGTFNQVRAGLEGEIFPNLIAKVRAGPQFRNYRLSSKPDFYSWVANVSLEYRIRKNLKLKTGFSRNAVEATFGNVNFYKEHLLNFGVDYQVRPKWTLFSEFRYFRHHYAERATISPVTAFRRDNHVRSRSGIRYEPQEWLDLVLDYEFLFRDSNFPDLEYTDHRVTLSSNLKY